MSLQWQPIHPATSELSGLSDDALEFVESDVYSGLTMTCHRFSLEVMAKLEFKFVGLETKSNVQCFMLEVAAYTPGIYKARLANDRVYFERRGVGFRVGVASWDVSIESASNLAAVAASVSMKGAKSSLEAAAYGGDAIETLKIFSQINAAGGLTPDTLQMIAAAAEEVSQVLLTGDDLVPQPLLAANIETGVADGWQPSAYSMQLAVESIYRKKNWNQALDDFARKKAKDDAGLLNPVLLPVAYEAFGITEPTQKPNVDQSDLAHDILMFAR